MLSYWAGRRMSIMSRRKLDLIQSWWRFEAQKQDKKGISIIHLMVFCCNTDQCPNVCWVIFWMVTAMWILLNKRRAHSGEYVNTFNVAFNVFLNITMIILQSYFIITMDQDLNKVDTTNRCEVWHIEIYFEICIYRSATLSQNIKMHCI